MTWRTWSDWRTFGAIEAAHRNTPASPARESARLRRLLIDSGLSRHRLELSIEGAQLGTGASSVARGFAARPCSEWADPSVYAATEAKQTINAGLIEYARAKVATVRRLHRASLHIPHAGGGTYPPKPLSTIQGGVLALESDWNSALGDPLRAALMQARRGRSP